MVFLRFSFFLLPLLCGVNAGRIFRFDYEYDSNINGWLKIHLIPATWHDAWLRCDLEGSILASPTDSKMKDAMEALWKANGTNQCGIYTGVHAKFSKGDFFSVDGMPLAQMSLQWSVGEPDNANNGEDCIILTNGTIADVNCSELFPYMCYRKKTKDMVISPCGTVDKGYELSTVTKNCYKFHRQGKIWSRACMTCSAEGGYLAIINGNDEALAVKTIYDKYYSQILPGTNKEVILLGIHDWDEHGVWRTIHGSKIEDAGYADWQPGQPDNRTAQFCGGMMRNAKLTDHTCDQTAAFVCEKIPDSLIDDNDFK